MNYKSCSFTYKPIKISPLLKLRIVLILCFSLIGRLPTIVNAQNFIASASLGLTAGTSTLKINTPTGKTSGCTTPVVSISADYCTTPEKVILKANTTTSGVSYEWSNGLTTQTITVDVAGEYSVSAISGACVGTAVISVGRELVTNGDFEAGNTAFFTDYDYVAPPGNNSTSLQREGLYAIDSNAHNYHSNFWGLSHTPSAQTGKFMIINGYPSSSTKIIWQETVSVLQNTNYYFSAWAMSLNAISPYAKLQFEVNGEKVGTIDTLVAGPSTASQATANNYWTRFYSNPKWASDTATTAVIQIINLEPATGGNDFGLDDISFATLSSFVIGPSVAGTDNQVLCPGTAIQPITYKVGGDTSGPLIQNLPPGVSSTFDGLTVVISGTPTTPGTYNYSVSGCTDFTDSGTIVVKTPGTWTGAISTTDWNSANNWSCGVPTSSTDVTIPVTDSTLYPVVSSTDTGYCKNITIAGSASVIIDSATLQIAGNITNSGAFNAANGTVEMNGSSAQTISGNMFYNNTIKNLVVSNTDTGTGLSVSSVANDTLKILGTLSFGNSNSTLNTGDNITLLSNDTATANVGIVGAGNTINGKVIVERYINVGNNSGQHGKSWQLLATPTQGQSVFESWMENGDKTSTGYGTQISGSGTGFDVYSAAPALKYYDYNTDNWVGITNTATPVYLSNGYMLFVRGDRSLTFPNVGNTTLRTKGSLIIGQTTAITVPADKFESVGNPYASAIDFTLINKGDGIDDKFYVWDPFISGYYNLGGYQTMSSTNLWEPVPGGSSIYPTDVPYTTIQSGQAFLAHATSVPAIVPPNYSISFSESSKVNGSGLVSFARLEGPSSVMSKRRFFKVSLFTGPNSTDKVADGNVVAFDGNFSNNVDGDDALKIIAEGENFGLKRNGKTLAIEARSPLVNTDTIYYNMSHLAWRTYQLRFAPENMQSSGLEAFLIDKFLNTNTPVSLIDSSFINITVTANAASSTADRFKVVFSPMSALPVTFTSVKAWQKNAGIAVEWKVENESNMQQYEVEKSLDGTNFLKVANVAANNRGAGDYTWLDQKAGSGYNYYRIRSIDGNGQSSLTQIVKVFIGNASQEISIFPNPIANGIINIQLTNQLAGIYNVRVLNSLGQPVLFKQITHSEGSGAKTITLNNSLTRGIYQVEITKPGGDVKIIKVMY